MKSIDLEWALINKKTDQLYRSKYGNRLVRTFFTREEARQEKRDIIYGKNYKVERVTVTYERTS